MQAEIEELKAKLALALDALELAEGVMSYCQGDAWERECTEDAREKFRVTYDTFFPPPPPSPPSTWGLYGKPARVKCDICGKACGGEGGVKAHKRDAHKSIGVPA
jgi:hypothetical protein